MSEDSIEDQKSIENKLQHYSVESETKKVETLNINDTEDSLDSFELIDSPAPDEIEIAGFNKKKLLEMCTFSKMAYGNNDPKLSQSGYETKAEFINKEYNIIPFYYTNGTLAGFVFTKDKEITIAYRGTQHLTDMITDINVWLTIPEFLPEGGRVHCGFYNAFQSSYSSLYDILKTHTDKQKLEIKDFKFYLTGHSMGGAIAKIAALFLSKVVGAQDLHVATFADPRVFDLAASESYKKSLPNRTIRVTQHRNDPVPAVAPGFLGYVHVGAQLRTPVMAEHIVHKIDGYYQAIHTMQESDFQPDNSASILYYPVRMLIIINSMTLGNTQYYAANFIRYLLDQNTPPICFGNTEDTMAIQCKHANSSTSGLFDYTQIAPQLRRNDFQLDNSVSVFYYPIRISSHNSNDRKRKRKILTIAESDDSSDIQNVKIKTTVHNAPLTLSLTEPNDLLQSNAVLFDVTYEEENIQSHQIQVGEDTQHLPPAIKIDTSENQSNDQLQKQTSSTRKMIYGVMIATPFIVVGIYTAVAFSAGIITFNSLVAGAIFTGVAVAAIACFTMLKISEKVGEEKAKNSDIAWTALGNVLATECLQNHENAINN